MSFVRIARRLLTGHPSFAAARRRARLAATPLDDRITPALTLVDGNFQITGGGNGTSELVAISQNGQYAIFGSTSTDLIDQQQDTPNSRDLFWTDLRLGTVELVTGTNPTTSYSGVLGPVDSFDQAVISDDGQSVAFTSKINASLVDVNFQGNQDSGNSTLDVFRWQPGGKVSLVSRTFDDLGGGKGRPSKAFGSVAAATDPAISTDGAQVSFVSTFNAENALPLRNRDLGQITIGNSKFNLTAEEQYQYLVDDDAGSKDIFVTDFNTVDSGGFFSPGVTTFRTRVMSSYGGDTRFFSVSNGFLDVFDTEPAPYYVSIGSKSGGVRVDPLGRYLSGDGKTAVFISTFDPGRLSNDPPATQGRSPTYQSNNSSGQAGGADVYRVEGTSSDLQNTVQVVSTTVGTGAGAVGSLSTTGGSAQAAVIVPNDSQLVVFAAAVGGSQITSLGTAAAGVQELYIRRMDNQIGSVAKLITAASGTSTTGFTTPSGGKLQTLDDGTVDPRAFAVSGNGATVAFASTAKANLLVPASKVNGVQQPAASEGNNSLLDVFVKDTNNGTTTLVSAIATTGGKQITGKQAAINPRVSADGRFVTFESTGSDYVAGLTDKNGTFDAFLRDLFIRSTRLLDDTGTGLVTGNLGVEPGQTLVGSNGTVPFAVFASRSTDLVPGLPLTTGTVAIFSTILSTAVTPQVSDSQLVGAISAGNGQVAFTSFDGQGNTVIGNRFTPFPGFTGELRVATYQVTQTNADGSVLTFTNMIVGTGPGVGGPRVALIDGNSAKVVRSFLAFEPTFNGGVYVAAGNNADGSPVLALGAGEGGGARLKLLTLNPDSTAADPLNDFFTQADFFSFESSFRGGVRPALGDFGSLAPANSTTSIGVPTPTPDGVVDLVAAAGEGGGPRVSIFDGARLRGSIPPAVGFTDPTIVPSAVVRLSDVFVFENRLRNGAYVSAGDFNNDGLDDLVAGAGPGGGPRVTVFEGKTLVTTPVQPTVLVNFFAFDPESSRSGVRVAIKNIDGDFAADVVAGSGAGTIPQIRTFAGGRLDTGLRPTAIDDFIPFNDAGVLSGAWVG